MQRVRSRFTSSSWLLRHQGAARIAMALNPSRLLLAFVFLFIAGSASAQSFTYTYFPSNTTINTPVTTDFAIVGYADGTFNEDDFTPNFTGPSSPTITIAPGADIPDAEAFNSSIINVTGGSIAASLHDNATMNISGGTVPLALALESSQMNVTGGTVSSLEAQGRHVNIMGGTIDILDANSNTDFFGANLGSCIVDVTGGTFTSEVNAFNDGILNLRGGQILGASLKAAEGGTLNIYGSGLAAQLLDPNAPNGYNLYTLSGQLADGSPLDGVELRVRNDGVTYGHSSFNLVAIPEPATALLLTLGGLFAACRRRPGRN